MNCSGTCVRTDMNPKELAELMHAVLDGEATAAQKRALERQLASDPAARSEFDALRGIFSELEALPPADPPEGLVAAVMAELPARLETVERKPRRETRRARMARERGETR